MTLIRKTGEEVEDGAGPEASPGAGAKSQNQHMVRYDDRVQMELRADNFIRTSPFHAQQSSATPTSVSYMFFDIISTLTVNRLQLHYQDLGSRGLHVLVPVSPSIGNAESIKWKCCHCYHSEHRECANSHSA